MSSLTDIWTQELARLRARTKADSSPCSSAVQRGGDEKEKTPASRAPTGADGPEKAENKGFGFSETAVFMLMNRFASI